MHDVTVTQLFNGELAGRGVTTHAVAGARGTASLQNVVRSYADAGEGWGLRVAMTPKVAQALGAYETVDGEWVVDIGEANPLSLDIAE